MKNGTNGINPGESETDIDIEIPIYMYSPGSFDQDSWPSDYDAAGELYGTILDMNGNTTIKHIGGSTSWDCVVDVTWTAFLLARGSSCCR